MSVDRERLNWFLRNLAVSTIASVTAWALAGAAGAADLVSFGVALVVGVSSWRTRPRLSPRSRASTVTHTSGVEPSFDLGVVLAAPRLASMIAGETFTLSLEELGRHVSVFGSTGSGKTTTLTRFMDAALSAGWPVVVVDAKGGRLADVTRDLGRRHSLPARVWLPADPDSWTYDICRGHPTAVANRLIGAFEHPPSGEVYRTIGLGVVAVIAFALRSSGTTCTLDTLRTHLDPPRLFGLARKASDPVLKRELVAISQDRLHREALAGLEGRLRALRYGVFGEWLLPSERTLDVSESLSDPGITYFGLPATGASEDVALVARVLVQELKQAAYASLRRGSSRPAMVVLDEFATLREAGQLVDLLLQSREANLTLVVSTQYAPRAPGLHHGLLGAGTLVLHQVGAADDADLLARSTGTRAALEVMRQLVLTPRRADAAYRRLVRRGREFVVSPDELQRLDPGQAFISIRNGRRRTALVQVEPLALEAGTTGVDAC